MRSRVTRHLGALFGTGIEHPLLRRQFLSAEVEVSEPKSTSLPQEFSWHDYAVYLLHVAAEIEHSLMVQYLFAAYSLGGPNVPEKERATVLDWQQTILGIAKEEMGHLLTVQNVLRLIGGGLNFDREDFPWDIPFYPFPFQLEKLSRSSLAKYVFAEAPDKWPKDITAKEQKEIEKAVGSDPKSIPHRVGQLYELMIAVLADKNALSDSCFREETVPFQASWDEWGRGYDGAGRRSASVPYPNVIVRRVSSRDDAVSILQTIARQGEWPDEDPSGQEQSHFRRFLKIFRAFPAPKEWSPVWDVATNPQAPGIAVSTAGPIIQDAEASLWSNLFNIRYRMLLAYLTHSFRLSAEPLEAGAANPRGMIIARTFAEMYALRSIAGMLVQLPLVDDSKPERAGPPFQMPYTTKLPAEEADCWRVHLDLLNAAAILLKELAKLKTPRAAYATALMALDERAQREIRLLFGSARTNTAPQAARRSLAI
jgi:hypothetical protein